MVFPTRASGVRGAVARFRVFSERCPSSATVSDGVGGIKVVGVGGQVFGFVAGHREVGPLVRNRERDAPRLWARLLI